MRNLKLFLLWWIFTLVWIFNFSSAWQIDYDFAWWSSIPLWLTCDFNNTELYINCCEEVSCDHNQWFQYKISWLKDVNSSNICLGDFKFLDQVYLEDWELSCFEVSDKMPISALTPAIDWLKESTYQIIPYVIYIWIWVLLVTLWFYAIRWLVNWIVWKINSYFSSKRD